MQFDRIVAVEIHPTNFVALPFRIEGLRVAFQVKKDLRKTTNTARITIYNLAETTRARIRKDDNRVLLAAGYRESVGLEDVFEGDIVRVNHQRQGPDILTIIDAADGVKAAQKPFVVSYAEGFSANKIIDDILKELGIPKKFVAKIKDTKMLKGFAHAGQALAALDKICQRQGLEYSIQDGQVQVLEKGGTNDTDQAAILVTPESGLVGSPERLEETEAEPGTEKQPPGWNITCLLQPKVHPGGWLAVRSKEIQAATAFPVVAVEHNGDSHGPAWTSKTQVRDPGVRI